MPGFALNHNVSFRCKVGYDARSVADDMDATIRHKSFQIRGKAVRAVPEPHPQRRRQYSRWYALFRALGDLRREGIDFEPCASSTNFCIVPTWELLGKASVNDDGEVVTEWSTELLHKLGLEETYAGGLQEMGVNTPIPDDDCDKELGQEDVDMDEGDKDAHPASQAAAASGPGRGGDGKGKRAVSATSTSTSAKNFTRGPDKTTEELQTELATADDVAQPPAAEAE